MSELKVKKWEKKNTSGNSYKFKCNMCEFTCWSSSGLKTHVDRKHTSYLENVVPIKCDSLRRGFRN